MNFQRRRRPQAKDTCLSTLCHMLQRQKGKKRQCKELKMTWPACVWSLLDRQGKETNRPVEKHVSEFVYVWVWQCVSLWVCMSPWLCFLLTVWVDLIKEPMDEWGSNPRAIYPVLPYAHPVWSCRKKLPPTSCLQHTLTATLRRQWLAHVHPMVLARDQPAVSSLRHCWRTSQHRHDGGEVQGAQREERMRQRWNRQGRSGVSLDTSANLRRSRGEVQCVDTHRRGRDRLSTPKHCPELMKQWAQIRTSIIQAGIDVTHHNQQLTSRNCRQHALFRMGGKCIAYMN